ncbi:CDC16 protein, partial [Kickxella alabastrina]
ECPLYARPSLPGVHACVQLVDECLAHTDAALYSHLRRHGAVAKIYAFPAAMTLSACVGPLRQVVRLWDFLLAFGVHLNVVCIVAQLLSMRELLVTTSAPMAFLRSWPPLRAESVIGRTREIYERLPEDLKRRIKLHAHDTALAEALASAPQVADPLAAGASLKRDLPLSPAASASASASATVLAGGGQGFAAAADDDALARPRARTFSGLVKRLRTAPVTNELMPTMMRASEMARPNYGSGGLGIMHQGSNAAAAAAAARAASGGSIGGRALGGRALGSRALGSSGNANASASANVGGRAGGGRRVVAGNAANIASIASIASIGTETLWMMERKLSAEYVDSGGSRY